jgi:hypothetical protein
MSKIAVTKGILVVIILVTVLISSAVSASVSIIALNSQSLRGTTGGTGTTGPAGATGQTGIIGATGEPGPPGPRGETGATGVAGETGPVGATGAMGAKGDTGATGAPGVAGANGATWFNGTGIPSTNVGINGDFYFDSASGDVYNKVLSGWTKVSNIHGATGATGTKGETGATGLQGPPGATVNNYTNIGFSGNLNYAGNNIGNVAITAPANGNIHITLTGYIQMYNNNSCLFGIGSNPLLTDLDVICVGVTTSGSTSQQAMYSLTSQAEISVTQGNTYTFYATAYRWNFDDSAAMTLDSVKMTVEFSEK